MKRVEYGKIIHYTDELRDDFANTNIKPEPIPADYPYLIKRLAARVASFLLLYLIAIPVLNFLNLVYFHIRIHGRHHIRHLKTGYILYGNHTAHYDALIPQALISRPRRTYILAHPDAVSIPFIKYLTKGLGAWPLGDTLKGTMRMLEAMQIVLDKHQVIAIYPEAHIWPFYTKIRPFPATSFQYASRNGVPAVPIVTTYRRPRGLLAAYRKPLMDVHIGEPIYHLAMFDIKENALRMHAHTISFMRCYASDKSNVALYEYVNKQGV